MAKKRKTNGKPNGRQPTVYKSYVFRGRDPIIDQALRWINQSGSSLSAIEKLSTVRSSTMKSWRNKTRRPQFCTIVAVAKAQGKTTIDL